MARIFASADRAANTYNSDFSVPRGYRGILIRVNKTAEGGATATLTFKLQYLDEIANTFEDLTDWEGNVVEFAAGIFDGGATAEDDLMVYPGIGQDVAAAHPDTANRKYSIGVPKKLRAVAVVAVANVTFSAVMLPLE